MSTKDLDFGNVIKMVYDPPTESLKVLATISIGSIEVDLDAATDSVRLGDGTLLSTLTNVGGRNALDVNIAGGSLSILMDHSEDSVRLGNGTDYFTSSTVGLKIGLDVNLINSSLAVTGPLTDTELRASPVAVTDANVEAVLNTINTLLSTGTIKVDDDETQTLLVAGNTILSTIESQLTSGTLKVDDDQTQTILTNILSALANNGLAIGTEDGTTTGTQHVFVNNLKNMLLASEDRNRDVSYLDIADKKNRRVDKFEYTSTIFPGITLVRQFNYSLTGTEYVFINDNWILI